MPCFCKGWRQPSSWPTKVATLLDKRDGGSLSPFWESSGPICGCHAPHSGESQDGEIPEALDDLKNQLGLEAMRGVKASGIASLRWSWGGRGLGNSSSLTPPT